MWEIYEHRSLTRKLSKIPREVLKRYEKWKDIVIISGPDGLAAIRGFYDEALKGEWNGFRSSRLGLQYRLIYKIVKNQFYVQIFDINPHNYRKRR
jgi:addiction module RelE/StbE family toxin